MMILLTSIVLTFVALFITNRSKKKENSLEKLEKEVAEMFPYLQTPSCNSKLDQLETLVADFSFLEADLPYTRSLIESFSLQNRIIKKMFSILSTIKEDELPPHEKFRLKKLESFVMEKQEDLKSIQLFLKK